MLETMAEFARRFCPRRAFGLTVAGGMLLAACSSASGVAPTPPSRPGTAASPREITVLAMEYQFVPNVIDVVPGEVVLIHFVNAGLATHELVLGDAAVQAAWEQAETAATPAPPGQTPRISFPPGQAGLRLVASSGERVDAIWQVPTGLDAVIAGCHVPGHWAKGMQAPVRLVAAPAPVPSISSEPAPSAASSPGPTAHP